MSFSCVDVYNRSIHSGLRQMSKEIRTGYRLAVNMAEAEYGIASSHPLFFFWLPDPDAALQSFFEEGLMHFIFFNVIHFIVNFVIVLIAFIAFVRPKVNKWEERVPVSGHAA